MANGTIHTFGTLKVNGTTYAKPSNPVKNGDCISYNGTLISIENTESGKELQWIELTKKDGTKLFICDRCLVVSVSWENLNAAGLIFGKEVIIDGKKYKLRSLTGSSGAAGTYGAGKNTEWDDLIDAVGESTDITHWLNIYSWCQETYYNNTSTRTIRGSANAARGCNNAPAAYADTYIGWRPVLEYLNAAPPAPTITTPVQNLRIENNGYIYYTPAEDPDGDTQKIKIEISESTDFSTKKTFTEMEKENAGEWHTVENITNADAGANMRTHYDTTATGKIYIRAVATDSGSGISAMSATVTASVGTVLEIETLPYDYDTMPEKITVAVKETRGEATQTIEVCNNANDDIPTWEAYVPTNGLHTFANKDKTADKWAVATKVTIAAGEETGAIEINAICQGVC